MQIVYADILFILDFAMDFISLYLTSLFINYKKSFIKLITSALIGATYGIISTIYPGKKIISVLIDILVALLLCAVSFGIDSYKRIFIKIMPIFYIISLLLGGSITFLYSNLNKIFTKQNITETSSISKLSIFLLFAAISALCIYLSNYLIKKSVIVTHVTLSVSINNNTCNVDAMIDSGNFLKDPITSKPVIVEALDSVACIIPHDIRRLIKNDCRDIKDLKENSEKRIRIIPVKSVSGSKTLIGVIPDKIEIIDDKNIKKKSAQYLQ